MGAIRKQEEKPNSKDMDRPLSEREEAVARRIAERVYQRAIAELEDFTKAEVTRQLEARQTRTPAPDDSERNALKQRVKRLEGELEQARADKEAAEEAAESLKKERDEWRDQFNGERDEKESAAKEAERLNGDLEPFKELLQIYRRYAKIGEAWRGILPTDTPIRFLAYGCASNTITLLWDAMRSRCERPGEIDGDDWHTMSEAFRFLLAQYNSTFDAPARALMTCKPGDKFDDALHMRAKDSSQYSGKVSKVLLQGIWDCNNKKALRKCVVTVE